MITAALSRCLMVAGLALPGVVNWARHHQAQALDLEPGRVLVTVR